jgi:hypothetical protein
MAVVPVVVVVVVVAGKKADQELDSVQRLSCAVSGLIADATGSRVVLW